MKEVKDATSVHFLRFCRRYRDVDCSLFRAELRDLGIGDMDNGDLRIGGFGIWGFEKLEI